MRKNRVYFIAGFSPRKGLLGVASYLHELEDQDTEFTRFYMSLDQQWANQEFSDDIVSVCYTKLETTWSWWLLSKRGKIISFGAQGVNEEMIPGGGTGKGNYGYLSHLALIEGTLYAAGMGRQVCRRVQSQWVRMDDEMRVPSPSGLGFRAIGGVDSKNIHAVGYDGEIWYFDGTRWHQAASPTNVILESICFVSPTLCYVCGKAGVVLRGFQNTWELVESKSKSNFWSIEIFQGRIYLAGNRGLFTIDGDEVRPLNLGREVQGNKLYTNGEELWSVEDHELWVFDGAEWKERICPDNA
jgi:hypothetical protein